MNLGIYINTLGDSAQLQHIDSFVSECIANNEIKDVSLFFDDINFNPFNIKCGLFNSTDLWSFNGVLIVTSLKSLNTSLNIINNIALFYYYGWEDVHPLDLAIATNRDIKLICNAENRTELHRLTNKHPVLISENFNGIIEHLTGNKNEYQSNNNDVYQTQ
jgi:hypothetical protein